MGLELDPEQAGEMLDALGLDKRDGDGFRCCRVVTPSRLC